MKITEELAAKLTNLFDLGYTVHIDTYGYEVSNVKSIGKLDYDDDQSPYVYSDDTISEKPLSEVEISDVKVYKEVNFITEEPEEQEEIDNETTYGEQDAEDEHDRDYFDVEEED